MYGNSSLLNQEGRYAYYGKVGGCLITGNEDGAKHASMNILYSLQHLGYVMNLARMLKDAGGMPAHGNQRALWDLGCRFDFVNPEYR